MPIYVYEPTIYSADEQVQDCCYFECLQSMGEKPLTHCPTCQHAVHRAVTSFYVKDGMINQKEKSTDTGNSNSQTAKNAARLAARHLCGAGCQH